MGEFVHLHLHSEFSLLDGACRIKDIVKRAVELGQKSIAITDHGSMYGAVDFYKECKANDIKPIIGCEVYVAPRTRFDKVNKIDTRPYHLVLLCKNEVGYKNLIKLVSTAYIEGFYGKPRIDHKILAEHSEGLVALSACLAGEIPRALSENDMNKAVEVASFYKKTFGEDFYIEIQDHGIKEQQRILPMLRKIARELDIKMVATNDCHYIKKEDSKTQAVLMCIQTNTVYGQTQAMEFETDEFYIKSYDEMESLFSGYDKALENTVEIADKCNFDFEFGVIKLPHFTAPNNMDNKDFFMSVCESGFKERYGENPSKELVDRFNYEVQIISQMGYIDYFLIVYDFINYAKQNDIPVGPGRGSGAGSIVAYSMGITGIDPIRFNLLFERFLNPERISMPDFDIDFCIEKRQKVIDYVIRKYGEDHVSQIITFGTMAAKGVIRDVARAMGIPYQDADRTAKLVPNELGMTLEKALLRSKELREAYQNSSQIKELLDTAMKLEGMPRHASMHAAGVIITRDPVDTYVPLQKKDDVVVTQYPMFTLEELGLLKMDFLGLRNLTVIRACENLIRRHDQSFDINKIDMCDSGVYDMLSDGDTEGVFQLESSGVRQVLTQLKPQDIEDIIAVISLYRPGPMESIPKYIRNRHNPSKVTYKHPILKSILDVTYGCIVYQEQVMQICQKMAGYSYGRADLVRRAMSKKKVSVMEQERQNFIYGKTNDDGSVECVGAIANGVSKEIATDIFDEMSSFASYAFNKSHAAAYAYVAYQTAYLKYHYKSEYLSALLSSVLSNTAKVNEYISYAKSHGIKVLPPDINVSDLHFTETNSNINFGLLAIKNLGEGVIKNIIEQRNIGGEFKDLVDFCERMNGKDVNKRAIESLIRSGAFDRLPHNRKSMLEAYERIVDAIDETNRKNIEGQIDLFSMTAIEKPSMSVANVDEYKPDELLEMEKEMIGIYMSGHPLDSIDNLALSTQLTYISKIYEEQEEQIYDIDKKDVVVAGTIQSKKVLNTKNNQQMAFLQLEDKTQSMEIVVFPNVYATYSKVLAQAKIIFVEGKISIREDEPAKVLCNRIIDIKDIQSGIEKLSVSKDKKVTSTKKENPKAGTLFLKIPTQDKDLLDKIESILLSSVGNDRVCLYIEDTKSKRLLKNIQVEYNETLANQLKLILNEDSVVYN